MDIIISALFCPMLLCRFARVYKSDNILSVWGLEEGEENKTGHIFLFLFIGCLWGTRNAVWQFTWLNTHEER